MGVYFAEDYACLKVLVVIVFECMSMFTFWGTRMLALYFGPLWLVVFGN